MEELKNIWTNRKQKSVEKFVQSFIYKGLRNIQPIFIRELVEVRKKNFLHYREFEKKKKRKRCSGKERKKFILQVSTFSSFPVKRNFLSFFLEDRRGGAHFFTLPFHHFVRFYPKKILTFLNIL